MKKVKLVILSMLAAISCKAPVDFDLVEDFIYLDKYRQITNSLPPAIPDLDATNSLPPAIPDLDATKKDLESALDIMETGSGKLGILRLMHEIQKYKLNNVEIAYGLLAQQLDADLNSAENVALLIRRCSMVEKDIPNAFTKIMPQEYYAYADIHPDVISEIFSSLPSWTRDELIIKVKKNIRSVLQSGNEALRQHKDQLRDIQCAIWEMEEIVDEPNHDTVKLLEEIEELENI